MHLKTPKSENAHLTWKNYKFIRKKYNVILWFYKIFVLLDVCWDCLYSPDQLNHKLLTKILNYLNTFVKVYYYIRHIYFLTKLNIIFNIIW